MKCWRILRLPPPTYKSKSFFAYRFSACIRNIWQFFSPIHWIEFSANFYLWKTVTYDLQLVCSLTLNFLSRKNTASIYPLLDWSKPGKSIVVSAAGILFVFIVHFFVYCMYRLRVCIFTNVCVRHHDDKDKTRLGMPRTISSLESGQKEHFLNSNTVVELKI